MEGQLASERGTSPSHCRGPIAAAGLTRITRGAAAMSRWPAAGRLSRFPTAKIMAKILQNHPKTRVFHISFIKDQRTHPGAVCIAQQRIAHSIIIRVTTCSKHHWSCARRWHIQGPGTGVRRGCIHSTHSTFRIPLFNFLFFLHSSSMRVAALAADATFGLVGLRLSLSAGAWDNSKA